MVPVQMKIDDADFQRGVRLFNGRRFFEAHEAWEVLWLRTPSPSSDREVYQGLIQLAAACHHLLRKNFVGARGCLKNAHGHLDSHLSEVFEFDLPELIRAIEQAVTQKDPGRLPVISVSIHP